MTTPSTPSSAEAKAPSFRITKGWFVTIVACSLATYAVLRGTVTSVGLGPVKLDIGTLSNSDPEKLKRVAEDVKHGIAPPAIPPPAPASDTERNQIEAITRGQPAAPADAQLQDLVG